MTPCFYLTKEAAAWWQTKEKAKHNRDWLTGRLRGVQTPRSSRNHFGHDQANPPVTPNSMAEPPNISNGVNQRCRCSRGTTLPLLQGSEQVD
jgi:hypothetical protein